MPKCRISNRRIEVVVTPGGKTPIEQLNSPRLSNNSRIHVVVNLPRVLRQYDNLKLLPSCQTIGNRSLPVRRGMEAIVAHRTSQANGSNRNCWANIGAVSVL